MSSRPQATPVALVALVALVAFAAFAPATSAQSVFRMFANGEQENPQTPTTNTASGSLYYDLFTGVLEYDFTVTGTTGSFNAAHIHFGAPDSNGPVRLALSGGPLSFQGSATLTASVAAELAAGDLYFNYHSTGFPGGEIRGQIVSSLTKFAAVANGAKETPTNGSTGSGTGTFVVNADDSVTYEVDFSGLSGTVFAGHVHSGKPGLAGGVIAPLSLTVNNGTSGTFSGTTAPIGAGDLARLRAGHSYLNIHSSVFPGGELRGQVVAAFAEYSAGCNGSATLSGSGVPAPGESVTISISGGVPGATGLLFVGQLGADINFAFDCNLAMAPTPIIPISLPPLDGAGAFSLPATIPASLAPVPALFCVPLQYFGADNSQPGGYFNTNGLSLCIDD